MDMIDGQPTGSVRVSFGYMSTLRDAQQLLVFIVECCVEGRATQALLADLTATRTTPSSPQRLSNGNTSDVESAELTTMAPEQESTVRLTNGEAFENKAERNGISVKSINCEENTWFEKEQPSVVSIPRSDSLHAAVTGAVRLSIIFLYPIKSCAAFEVRFGG